jgi:hypothetical protein
VTTAIALIGLACFLAGTGFETWRSRCAERRAYQMGLAAGQAGEAERQARELTNKLFEHQEQQSTHS